MKGEPASQRHRDLRLRALLRLRLLGLMSWSWRGRGRVAPHLPRGRPRPRRRKGCGPKAPPWRLRANRHRVQGHLLPGDRDRLWRDRHCLGAEDLVRPGRRRRWASSGGGGGAGSGGVALQLLRQKPAQALHELRVAPRVLENRGRKAPLDALEVDGAGVRPNEILDLKDEGLVAPALALARPAAPGVAGGVAALLVAPGALARARRRAQVIVRVLVARLGVLVGVEVLVRALALPLRPALGAGCLEELARQGAVQLRGARFLGLRVGGVAGPRQQQLVQALQVRGTRPLGAARPRRQRRWGRRLSPRSPALLVGVNDVEECVALDEPELHLHLAGAWLRSRGATCAAARTAACRTAAAGGGA
mmetsp:Transcript_102895/g.231054  ORF Transcript_102895/g.231054 Transcript_102895/m.231054 type:complete len:363 (-) Transcript_102895:88-1176(-)